MYCMKCNLNLNHFAKNKKTVNSRNTYSYIHVIMYFNLTDKILLEIYISLEINFNTNF